MTAAHYQTLTLNTRLREWVPEHEPREHDPLYKGFHVIKVLLRKHDVPCWRCGVKYETLVKKGDAPTPDNPLGAYQLEAHHFDLEYSVQNGVDVEKWWAASHVDETDDHGHYRLVQAFSSVDGWLANHPQYQSPPNVLVAAEETAAWHKKVFDAYMESEGNLMQLCDVCHRSKDQGIHHIPYPDWRPGRNVWRGDLPAHIQ